MKTVKISLFICSLCLFVSSSLFAQKNIKGQGPIVKETVSMNDITKIGLSIPATVYLSQGRSQEIIIEGQKNIIDNIKKRSNGKSWDIKFHKNVSKHEKVKIYITIQNLEALAIGGSGSIIGKTKFSNMDDLKVSIGGSGDVKIEGDATNVKCSIGGSGEVELGGSADRLDISIGGSGDVDAMDMQVKKCNVSIGGSGDTQVHVTEKLAVSSAGSGDVKYKGNPKIKSSMVGSGDLEQVN